jgi:hypothetical protein
MKTLKKTGELLLQILGWCIIILYIIGHHIWEAVFHKRK